LMLHHLCEHSYSSFTINFSSLKKIAIISSLVIKLEFLGKKKTFPCGITSNTVLLSLASGWAFPLIPVDSSN